MIALIIVSTLATWAATLTIAYNIGRIHAFRSMSSPSGLNFGTPPPPMKENP